jgi:hypothetical protein
VARAVVVVVIIVAAAAVAGKVVAVDQEGVGGGKLLHTPTLRTVGTGAGFSPEDVQELKERKKQCERASFLRKRCWFFLSTPTLP